MKSLKLAIALFALLFTVGEVYAQQAYLNVNLGYGFRAGSTDDVQITEKTTIEGFQSTSETTQEVIKMSYGGGLNGGATFGMLFNDNFGAEVGVNYLLGSKQKVNDESTTTFLGETSVDQDNYTMSGKMLRIMPALVVQSDARGTNYYGRFGVALGTGSITSEYTNEVSAPAGNTKSTLIAKEKGGWGLGYHAALGILSEINKSTFFFVELTNVNMNFAPTMGEYTEATNDGEDVLKDWNTSQKEYEMVDELTTKSTDEPSPDSPSTYLRSAHPFSSFGLGFGIRINVGG